MASALSMLGPLSNHLWVFQAQVFDDCFFPIASLDSLFSFASLSSQIFVLHQFAFVI
jgi:hypothetical protein